MKTNEEKLKQLLTVAYNNGWEFFHKLHNLVIVDTIKITNLYNNFYYQGIDVIIEHPDCNYKSEISLNDLVTNFEPNEIGFVEALCNKNINKEMNISDLYFYSSELSLVEAVRLEWNLQPTSQRLEWLFKTFEHLL